MGNVIFPRLVYNTDKETSKVARQIEAGEEVQGVKIMSLQEATWMVTKGDGMGKRIYRCNHNLPCLKFYLNLCVGWVKQDHAVKL